MSFKRILLIKPSGRHGLSYAFDLVPTGLEYIAAMIEDIVDEVTVLDIEMENRPFAEVIKESLTALKPDLVGITMSATEHSEGLEIARLAKEHGAFTVMGGYHASAITDELLSYEQVDVIIRGEGERTMRELVEKGGPQSVLGLSYKENGKVVHNPDRELIEDLDLLPFPARHLRRYAYGTRLSPDRDYDTLTVSRGCLGRCTFCCEPTLSKGVQRFRSPENVMKEILEMVSFHKNRPLVVDITDPNFLGRPELVEQLCDLLAPHKLDIYFMVKVRADSVAENPEIVRKMIAVGIDGFEMGIESPNMKDIISVAKGMKTGVHVRAVDNIKQYGGNAGGTFVIGLPGQSEEEILQFPSYAKSIGLTGSAYGIATPFPDTRFYDDLKAKDLIFETDWNRFDEMHSVFKVEGLTAERIEELASICMARFWTMDTFLEKERMQLIRSGRKKSLYLFLREKVQELTISLDMGSQLQNKNVGKHVRAVIEASADPGVEIYTRKVGMHNLIEMSRFLRILGDQTVQLTLKSDGAPVTSWIIETAGGAVEYVKVVPGRTDKNTVNLELEMNDFNFSAGHVPNPLDILHMVCRMLASNRGLRKAPNLFRLLMAGGVELVVGYLRADRN